MTYRIGQTQRIVLPGDVTRLGKILAEDSHGEMVLVRWVEYDLPDEWIPSQWL